MRFPVFFIIVVSLMVITGCRTVAVVPAPHATMVIGHPPHAPAHGYRYHYHDHDLEYDSDLGAYIVLGFDGVYFYNDLYLRFYAGDWQVVDRMDGRWRKAEYRHIPGKLRSHQRYKRHARYENPPLHPRDGYRHHHHHGVDLEFDNDIGAYFVVGFDGIYFYDNLYLRFFDGYWHVADRYDGRWRRAEHRHVPRELWRHKRYQRYMREAPPPHAPAHGYRHHHHHGVDLVFDSGIGAYVVLGFDNLFFLDGNYMRFVNDRWQISDRYDGRWRQADDRYIPGKLRQSRGNERQNLFNRINKQYQEEHRQERDYRERHYKDSKKDRDRDGRRDDYRDRDRDRDRDRSNHQDRNKGNSKGDTDNRSGKKLGDKETRKAERLRDLKRDDDEERDGNSDDNRKER